MKISFFLSLLAISSLPSTGFSQKMIGDFRLGWKPGATYEQKLAISQKIGLPIGGTAKAETNVTVKLKPKDNGAGRLLELNVSQFKTDVDLPLPKKNERFDSLTPDEGNRDIASFYQTLSAARLKGTLDTRGQVTALTGMDAMSVESPVLKRFLGKEQLAILLRQGWFLSMPSKSIGIGESWPFALQLPTPMGNVKLAGVYKLTGSETRGTVPCWKLEVSGEMTEKPAPMQKSSTPSTDAKEAELEDKLAAMGLSVNKANLSGVIYFNPAEQLIHDSEILTDIKIGLAKVTSTTTSKPMELPISQKLTLELRRVP